uniref:Uncharacterized protein LOC116940884 n=1 Tax=Petromyzon marinus TaxID=7757 RepID=A0AAJ7SYL0_PETMA|nr:uncharacterized protein LOC116940884 [Petromyzon marinus]
MTIIIITTIIIVVVVMGVMIALTVALSAMLGCARSSQPMDNLSLSSSTRVEIPDAGACWTCSLPLQHELHQRRHHQATTQQQQQRRHEHQDRQHYDHHHQQQSTGQRGELASILTEAVKQHILARLQLRAPPNVSRRAPVPRRAVLSALRRLHHHGGSRPLTGAPAHGVHQTWAGHARRRAGYDDDASTSDSSDKGDAAADDDNDDYDDDSDEDEDYDDGGGGGRAKYGHSSRRGERRQRGEMSEIVSFAEPDRGWSGELRFHVLGEGGRRLHVNQASLWLYLRMEGAGGKAGGAAGGGVRGGGRAKGGPRGGANLEAGGRGGGGGDLDSSSASVAVVAGEDKTKSSDVTGGVDSRSGGGGGGADGGGTARGNPRHKWHHHQQQQQHKQQRQRLRARNRQRAALVTVRIQVAGAAPSSPSFSKRLMLRRASWRAVPLEAAAVRAALERAGGRVSLRVSCPDCGPAGVALGPRRASAAAAAAARVDPSAHRAFLLLRARDSGATRARGRKRRRGLECDGVAAPLCCRRHFYVDFGAIGWADWIIAPAGYFANYCEGKCPAFMSGALGTAASFHSAVLSQYRLRDTTAPGAGSCCIPTRLSAMSMLYFDEDQNIVKKDVPNMIVEECGCV